MQANGLGAELPLVSGIAVPPAPLNGDECEQGAIPSALLT